MRALLIIKICILSFHFAFSQEKAIAEFEGKVIIGDTPGKIIMKSPDGKCWQLSIANDGQITSDSVLCETFTTLNVTVKNTDTYIYEYVANDEDLLFVHEEPLWAILSNVEIFYTPIFRWEYQYKPFPFPTGNDKVILAIYTGSNSEGLPTHVEYLTINFNIIE